LVGEQPTLATKEFNMYHSILVPLDGSPFGEHALPLAMSLARRTGATLQLLNVLTPIATLYAESPMFIDDQLEQRLRDRQVEAQQKYLDQVARRIEAVSPLKIVKLIDDGEIAPTIRAQAIRNRSDLVVMTTHGRGPLERFWLGSTADELVRESPVPVLLIRPTEEAVDLTREPSLKHIMVPLDGTELAERMLPNAVALGRFLDADYTLVRVVQPVGIAAPGAETSTIGFQVEAMLDRLDTLQKQIVTEARDYLERKAQPMREAGLKVALRVDVAEQPATAILQDAVAPVIDLVALETHGRSGLSRLFLGSVADKVIRGAHVAVLVHHPTTAA
jgi:nucleotide-binding universal stress UspA family protein